MISVSGKLRVVVDILNRRRRHVLVSVDVLCVGKWHVRGNSRKYEGIRETGRELERS